MLISKLNSANIVTDADALAYVKAVYSAGGALSFNQQKSINSLFKDLKAADNPWSRIGTLGLFLGGSLTPSLVKAKGTPDFTNSAFIAGDYTDALGLKSTSGSKFIDSGVNASSVYANANFSCGVYFTDDSDSSAGAPSASRMVGSNVASGALEFQIGNGAAGSTGMSTAASKQNPFVGPQLNGFSSGPTTVDVYHNHDRYNTLIAPSPAATLNYTITPFKCISSATTRYARGAMGLYFDGLYMTVAQWVQMSQAFERFMIAIGRVVNKGNMVCFGDSITLGNDSLTTGRWTRQISDYYNLREANMGLPSSELNVQGIVASGINRYTSIARYNPSRVVIAYGTNDIKNTDLTANGDDTMVATYKANLKTVINYCISIGVPVANITCCTSTYFTFGSPSATKMGKYVTAASQAASETGCKFANTYQKMLDNVGSWSSADGIHPDNAGHTFIFQSIRDAV